MPEAETHTSIPAVLLSYQQVALASKAAVRVWEKSRRIGASWGFAEEATETGMATREAGGDDVLYIGYNLDMAREFIDDCAFWARHIAGFAADAEDLDYDDTIGDERRSIKALRITFPSGFEIIALSSRPRSLRGRQGLVIIDEAAFHDDLPGILKAAMALLIWGGRVVILSTHDGEDNPFNELVQDVREGRKPYELFRTTFDDAVSQGLYKRICLKTGETWSPERELQWVAEVRAYYDDDADEELDVIPSKGKGVYITRAMVEACTNPHLPVVRLKCEDGFAQKSDHEREAFAADWLEEHVDPLLKCLAPNCASYFGEDFGRTGDLTVIVPIQELPSLIKRIPFVVELRNVPFKEQEQILMHIVDGLPRFTAGKLDARGNGQFLAERAAQKHGELHIEQVMLTANWYLEHMPPMKAAFEDRNIEMPRDPDLRDDLRQIKIEKGIPKVPDNSRTKGQDGGQRHGDFAVACCLAFAASNADVPEYDYEPAPIPKSKFDEGSDWGDGQDDHGERSGLAHMRGAW